MPAEQAGSARAAAVSTRLTGGVSESLQAMRSEASPAAALSGTRGLPARPVRQPIIALLNPVDLATRLWGHRDLILQFTWRDIEGRYKGSLIGVAWAVLQPLALLLIYTFVFGVVFELRWSSGQPERLRGVALVIFCSLTAFNLFGEGVSRAPGLIVAVPHYVKKVVFPLEILPVTAVGASMFHAAIGLCLLLVGNLILKGQLHPTALLLPVVALPVVFLSLGLSWWLASLGVFVRDVGQAVGLAVHALLFLTPVLYPIQSLPANLIDVMRLNPLAMAVEDFRRTLLWGQAPDWWQLAASVPLSLLVMLLGYAWFMRTKKAFADVI